MGSGLFGWTAHRAFTEEKRKNMRFGTKEKVTRIIAARIYGCVPAQSWARVAHCSCSKCS